jgi:hypothetical protein
VIANGLVNATLKVETRAKGPEFVTERETLEFTEASSTVSSPPAVSNELANAFAATSVKGFVKKTLVKTINATPASENIAVTAMLPRGLAYEAPVEKEKEEVFTAPHGTTYSFPEPVSGGAGYTVTGKGGENVELKLEHVNGGIESTLEAFDPTGLRTLRSTAVCEPPEAALGEPIPIKAPIEKAEYKNWVLSGALVDRKLGLPLALPEGSTFNGSGELNTETGAGSVKGSLSIPPITTTFKLLGFLTIHFGTTLTQVGPFEGAVAKSETVPGDETLTIPAKLNLGITSIGIFGLTFPTNCATAEPIGLNLSNTLTREELLTKGWSFGGTSTLPSIQCEGGVLGSFFGVALTHLLSGPGNPYSLKFSPPAA